MNQAKRNELARMAFVLTLFSFTIWWIYSSVAG